MIMVTLSINHYIFQILIKLFLSDQAVDNDFNIGNWLYMSYLLECKNVSDFGTKKNSVLIWTWDSAPIAIEHRTKVKKKKK